jgi:leucyl aminopeptidase
MPQNLLIQTAPLPAGPAGLIVIYAAEGVPPRGAAGEIWAASGLDIERVAASVGFKGKPGQAIDIAAPGGLEAKRLLVLGAGKAEPGKPASGAAWADRGGSLAAKIAGLNAGSVAVVLDGHEAMPAMVAELAAGVRLRHYKFDRYKTRKKDDESLTELTITIHVPDPVATRAAIDLRMPAVEGQILARDLINEPPNVLGTVEFADRAASLADKGIAIDMLGPDELEAHGMRSLLAVAQGSIRPARLVVMRWNGGDPATAPLAFVGKGVVFDSGGISIKPAANMEDMKGDMGGAAAVTGLMHALASRKAKANVIGVIGLVENMPSGTSMRPGDIVRAMSGTTIEIVNTDAEGRLILADGLSYATKLGLSPIVDAATLTGAISVALGRVRAGLFCNDEALQRTILAAAESAGERIWPMPMDPEYREQIRSEIADVKQTGGRPGGSITAAMVLSNFVGETPWAHLDIANVNARATRDVEGDKGATGFGVRTFTELATMLASRRG